MPPAAGAGAPPELWPWPPKAKMPPVDAGGAPPAALLAPKMPPPAAGAGAAPKTPPAGAAAGAWPKMPPAAGAGAPPELCGLGEPNWKSPPACWGGC